MIKKVLKYPLVSLLSLISMVFVLGGSIWAYSVMLTRGSAPYILHFDDVNGITKVGGISNLVLMAILAVFIVLLNFFIALELEARDKVLGRLVAAVTLVMAVLLFIGFVAILSVN